MKRAAFYLTLLTQKNPLNTQKQGLREVYSQEQTNLWN